MLFNIISNKKKKKGNSVDLNLYSFNMQEIEELNKKEKERLKDLKKKNIENVLSKKKNILESINKLSDNISQVENKKPDNSDDINNLDITDTIDESIEQIKVKEKIEPISYINLTDKQQKLISDSFDDINLNDIDNYINSIDDLLSHNYSISYCDDCFKLINDIRHKYKIIIDYLIGFNNEKNGIFNKVTFGDNENEEWRYLSEYLKLLKKIRKIINK